MEDVDRFMHFYCTFFTKIGMGSTLWAPDTCRVQHTKKYIYPWKILIQILLWLAKSLSEFPPKLQPLSFPFLVRTRFFTFNSPPEFSGTTHQQNEGVD